MDVSNYERFVAQARIHLDGGNSLIVDLSAVEFLDSTAMGALVALANQARSAGAALYLVAVPKTVHDLLTLVRLDHFFEILPDVASAEQRRATPESSSEPEPVAGGWAIVRGPRIFDTGTAPTLLAHCEQSIAQHSRLIVDLSETVFLASAGMAALIKLDRIARDNGGELRVAGCSAEVLRTLKLVKLDSILKVYPTTADALVALPQSEAMPLPGTVLQARS